MCGECTDCEKLESRVEDLEDFIWENFIEPGCRNQERGRGGNHCAAADIYCYQSFCPRFKSIMEWRK